MDDRIQHEKQNFTVFEFRDSDKKNSYTFCKLQNQYYQHSNQHLVNFFKFTFLYSFIMKNMQTFTHYSGCL